MSSPLQLDGIHVTKIAADLNEDGFVAGAVTGTDSPDQYSHRADFRVFHSTDEPQGHLVELDITFRKRKDADNARFLRVEVKLRGFFTPTPGADQEVVRRTIPGNCLAMLHGTARGIVLAATSACPGGAFLLPAINYQELIEKKTRALRRRVTEGGSPPDDA